MASSVQRRAATRPASVALLMRCRCARDARAPQPGIALERRRHLRGQSPASRSAEYRASTAASSISSIPVPCACEVSIRCRTFPKVAVVLLVHSPPSAWCGRAPIRASRRPHQHDSVVAPASAHVSRPRTPGARRPARSSPACSRCPARSATASSRRAPQIHRRSNAPRADRELHPPRGAYRRGSCVASSGAAPGDQAQNCGATSGNR